METIALLQTALADEYFAAIQYHNGARLVHNVRIKREFVQHANEELNHADLLSRRIRVLGGTPVLASRWEDIAFCGYTDPSGDDKKILQQNINAEMCAIGYYQNVLNKIEVDSRTKDVVAHILEQEYEHLYDLTDLLEV